MRIKLFSLILVFCLVVLLAGLAYIQVFRHARYSLMSEENRLKIVPYGAPRGCIFDRNDEALVKDVISFNISVIYSRIRDKASLADVLSSILGAPKEGIETNIKKARMRPYTPACVAEDVGIEKAIHAEELSMDHPGLMLEVSAKRRYMYGRVASNILGYLGMINRSEFERLKPYGYRMNDLVGKDGIEKYYDEYLRGTHGGKQIEVDYRGREAKTLGFREPVPGKDIHLTIDLELQRFCDGLLENKRGAILAMDPDSGSILAMASAPSYDPSIFIDRKRRSKVRDILKDKNYPLLNRSISGVYPPGSIFKVVIAAGALETGVSSPETVFFCPGYLKLGRATFRCWRKNGHGEQDLKEAIKNSCNVYFFRLGLLLGAEKIAEYARKFGFGSSTGIDLPGERGGTLPDPGWKKKRFKEKWYKGDTVNYSIGQGYLLCTPVQIARAISVFANGGYLVRPYVVSGIGGIPLSASGKVDLDISPKNLETVRQGLKKVVNDPRGTGMKARLKDVVVAGKTGTAQTSKGKSHGWFMGFAPFEQPRLTVVIFDEYGGKGGYYAAETAGMVFKKAE
ncbi:MAG: penicillin-binding protein 2, partial [Candidatus Omnitrophota bacterium]|nr:penicillin-binding protein 2 [Candidatus Omnitrophota bacterium]